MTTRNVCRNIWKNEEKKPSTFTTRKQVLIDASKVTNFVQINQKKKSELPKNVDLDIAF